MSTKESSSAIATLLDFELRSRMFWVGVGEKEKVGVAVTVGVVVEVAVPVALAVRVEVGVWLGTGLGVAVTVGDGGRVAVVVALRDAVGLAVRVAVCDGGCDCVGVAVDAAVNACVAVRVALCVAAAVGVIVGGAAVVGTVVGGAEAVAVAGALVRVWVETGRVLVAVGVFAGPESSPELWAQPASTSRLLKAQSVGNTRVGLAIGDLPSLELSGIVLGQVTVVKPTPPRPTGELRIRPPGRQRRGRTWRRRRSRSR